MPEKLCLKWNDFQENVNLAFGNLREDKEFADVTLASEDGQEIEAHKVILAASSPFFQDLLRRNKHPHPLIYMRGIKSENLLAIVDFLYNGEASVYQENLDSFLLIAEELKLKGLMGQMEDVEKKRECNERDLTPLQMNTKPFYKRENSNTNTEQIQMNLQTDWDNHPANVHGNIDRRIAIPNFVTGDFQELDEKVKSMMEASQNRLPNAPGRAKICKVCGKEGQSMAIRDHIEANHLEGVSLPCNVCEKTFRSRKNLRRHKCIVL